MLADKSGDIVGLALTKLKSFEFDPLGFVLWAFPWGKSGSVLARETGPEAWQMEILDRMGRELKAGGDSGAVIREAAAAGHGVGKSAFMSWVILWAMTTKPRTRGIVTANTESQLKQKTWAELGKWFSMFVAKDLFELTATALFPKSKNDRGEWRIDQSVWNESNTEAFTGLHNKGRRIILLFDEASAIPDSIYEVAEGALTDEGTQIIWIQFGNPTRTNGRFYDTITGNRANWNYTSIDSRSVRFSNKRVIDEWKKEYGEESDFFRVRVRGLPPRAGVTNLISPEAVRKARDRRLSRMDYQMHSVVISLDPARFGDDKSVITVRQGPMVHEQIKYMGMDEVEICNRVVDTWKKYPETSAVVVEVAGLAGGGHATILRRIHNLPVVEYSPSSVREKDSPYVNMRAECYCKMRDWLETAHIPDDDELAKQLTTLQYGYTAAMKVQIQSKKDMKSQGLESPDCADSLALSFAVDTIERKRVGTVRARPVQQRKIIWSRG